jgi:hypothetical protein
MLRCRDSICKPGSGSDPLAAEEQIHLESPVFHWIDHWKDALLLLADLRLIDSQGPAQARKEFASLLIPTNETDHRDGVWPRLPSAAAKTQDLDPFSALVECRG